VFTAPQLAFLTLAIIVLVQSVAAARPNDGSGGGTLTTADGGLSPAVRGTGLGTWWRVRGGGFAAVTEAFLFNGGVRTGLQRISQEIEVVADGDEFNANVTSEIEDTSGNVIATGCATSIGRRL
jgi:hypothetical protein